MSLVNFGIQAESSNEPQNRIPKAKKLVGYNEDDGSCLAKHELEMRPEKGTPEQPNKGRNIFSASKNKFCRGPNRSSTQKKARGLSLADGKDAGMINVRVEKGMLQFDDCD